MRLHPREKNKTMWEEGGVRLRTYEKSNFVDWKLNKEKNSIFHVVI